jgi:hypothetical protein
VADDNSLRSFERRIPIKIFRPVWDRGERRICHNAKLNGLIKGRDIVRFVKAQRRRWLGHVERISEERMPKRMLKGRLLSRRRKGRQRTRWLDGVATDPVVRVTGWRGTVEDREAWRGVVKEAKAHQGL